MNVEHVMDKPAHNIANEAALRKSDPELVGIVHIKPWRDINTNMTCHQDVKAKDDKKHKLDCKSKI